MLTPWGEIMNAMAKDRQSGFTLLELMIVLVVIAILAALAYPSYQDYVRKSRRSEAISTLLNLQLEQEKWRANNTTYNSTLYTNDPDVDLVSGDPDTVYYDFKINSADATTYVLEADPKTTGKQNQDKERGTSCDPLTIDQNGDGDPAACFKK